TDCSASMLCGGVRSKIEFDPPGPAGKSRTLTRHPLAQQHHRPQFGAQVSSHTSVRATRSVDSAVDNVCRRRPRRVGSLGTTLWKAPASTPRSPAELGKFCPRAVEQI